MSSTHRSAPAPDHHYVYLLSHGEEPSDLLRRLCILSHEAVEALIAYWASRGRVACGSCAHVPESSRQIMSCGCLTHEQSTSNGDPR